MYVPWFATRTPAQIWIACLVFTAMTAFWLVGSHWLVQHPTLGARIRRHGPRAMPFILIALGITILYEAGSIGLFG